MYSWLRHAGDVASKTDGNTSAVDSRQRRPRSQLCGPAIQGAGFCVDDPHWLCAAAGLRQRREPAAGTRSRTAAGDEACGWLWRGRSACCASCSQELACLRPRGAAVSSSAISAAVFAEHAFERMEQGPIQVPMDWGVLLSRPSSLCSPAFCLGSRPHGARRVRR